MWLVVCVLSHVVGGLVACGLLSSYQNVYLTGDVVRNLVFRILTMWLLVIGFTSKFKQNRSHHSQISELFMHWHRSASYFFIVFSC